MHLTRKPFEAWDRKNNREKNFDLAEKISWTEGLWKQQFNMSPINGKN